MGHSLQEDPAEERSEVTSALTFTPDGNSYVKDKFINVVHTARVHSLTVMEFCMTDYCLESNSYSKTHYKHCQ